MANFVITGKIIEKFDTQKVSDSFQKREFVLEISEQGQNGMVYTNFASFQLAQNNVNLIDSYNVGDEIKVNFDIRGNKWERKDGEVRYITNLNAWRIEPANNVSQGQGQTQQQQPTMPSAQPQKSQNNPPIILDTDSDDDLPF